MLSLEKLKEIREHLENSQNPLFLFDNDSDGFCAFLILRKSIDRGKGIAIKSFPDLSIQYLKRIDELNPDSIFILDKAEVSTEFIDGTIERNIPLIWIDHHRSLTNKKAIKKIFYYNSLPSAEPTTYMAQKVFDKKETRWLAMIGCIGDVYKPEFSEEFEKEFPELFNSKISPFEALHSTEIGKMVRILNFGLKDTTTNVVKLIKYLFSAKNAYDILEANQYTRELHKRYSELNEFYKKQIEKAKNNLDKKSPLLFFSYSGKISLSSEIANRLYYDNKNKLIVVAFKKLENINVSIRGKNALKITKELLKIIPDSIGGGHPEATGTRIPIEEFKNFKKEITELAEKNGRD
tara:strand:+ start:3949 stop:4998 length:1050 start_codon:yes stop_codon:yes gene_type:complete